MDCSLITHNALMAVYGRIPGLPVDRADVRRLRLAVAGQLFARAFGDDAALDDFLEDQDQHERSNVINRHLVEATGIGPTLFTITSLSHPELAIGVETSLLDFDKAHFQEIEELVAKAEKRELRPYQESLYKLWTRSVIDGELLYGFLSAAGPFLWTALEDALFEWVDATFEPYRRSGNTQEAIASDIKRQIEAPEPHEKLRNDAYASGSSLINTMLNEEGLDRIFAEDGPWVSRKIEADGHETREQIVFSNASALELVRLGSFHADVASLPDGTASFEARMSSLVEEFLTRLKELAPAPKVSADG
ncbi:hypothetical protein HFO56_33945 [Rhizobium laguerreae]|uniref:hypothetical protein n=1 Tax=Rhizobium laguerreae TaxID=1076926 RepID=UPI001C921C9F|nr:hypothetical protein [Rhizobium laguerreae]MBY3157330.1 hypothetical protein [Rhizobium laguerreae]